MAMMPDSGSFARACVVAVLIVVVAPHVATPAEPGKETLAVAVEAGRVTVHADGVPLSTLLEAIGEKAGISVVIDVDLGVPATCRLENLPLDEVLERILRGYGTVFVYERASGTADDVALVSVRVLQSPSAARGSDPGRLPPRARSGGATQRESTVAQHSEVRRLLHGSRPAIEHLVKDLATTRGAEAAVRIMQDLFADSDPLVRRASVWGLARLGRLDGLFAVRSLSDQHPLVRAAAEKALDAAKGRDEPGQ